MQMKPALAATLALLCASVSAQTACANSGAPPPTLDPALAPKIVAWVKTVEDKFNLRAMRLQGPRVKAPTKAQADALELQATVVEWQREAPRGSVDSIFRSAVSHGVNVQYETLMAVEDIAHADTHRKWADIEAARANACLALTQSPQS